VRAIGPALASTNSVVNHYAVFIGEKRTHGIVQAHFSVFFRSLLFLLPIPCIGALRWENLQATESAFVGDKSVLAVFRFQNAGASQVTITSVQSSCGCTTVALSKTTYAPGESGEIKATLEIGNLVGQQTKLITVISSDSPSKPTELVLDVNVRALATFNPGFLYWRIGESTVAKRVDITASGSQTITAVDAVPSSPSFRVRIEEVELGKKYILWLTPTSTEAALKVTVSCLVRTAERLQPAVSVYAAVIK
jgi:hypothetical protein